MIFHASHIYIASTCTVLLMAISAYIQYSKKNEQYALLSLLLAAFVLRLFMASVDPFLQEWDERFHALVAKNIIESPFQPMLRVDPVLPYKMEDWCCNHIWVHKQPLFLWQMALSMRIFGVHEIAIRLPSVIMGTMAIFFVYDIARKWTKDTEIAYLAAALLSVSYFQLELTSGRFPLDQNDVTFAFYVTASIWAWIRYLHSDKLLRWSVIIGIFVGGAVLNKWLTGILIFGGWGLYELLFAIQKNQLNLNRWKFLLLSILVSLAVFVPWQLYIMEHFPAESGLMYEHNRKHIFEVVEGHAGTIWFHFNRMRTIYGQFLLIFIPLGAYAILSKQQLNQRLSLALFAMVVVIYSFFSFLVQTKMPAFVYPVHVLIWITISAGIMWTYRRLFQQPKPAALLLLTILCTIYTLKPWQIAAHRSVDNTTRNHKIQNTLTYKSLDLSGNLADRIIINCKAFEDVELMFYQEVNAYHWYPDESTLDSLLLNGHTFAAFKNHNNQLLPEYIYSKSSDKVIILEHQIK